MVPTDVPAEVPAEVVPTDVPAEVPAEVVPTDVPADEVAVDVPPIEDVCTGLSFTACGGDPTGFWNVLDFCMPPKTPPGGDNPFSSIPGCEAVTFVIYLHGSGTLQFNADKSFATHLIISQTTTGGLPDACLEGIAAQYAPGTANDAVCAGLADELKSTFDKGCTYGGGVCACSASPQDGAPTDRSGTWAVDGTGLVYTVGGTAQPAVPFCITDDRIVLQVPETTEAGAPLDYIVAQRGT